MPDFNVWPKILDGDRFKVRKRITTIWLASYPQSHLYYCPDCRMPMFSYQGEIVSEMPGNSPVAHIPIEIKCKNELCGRVVRIEAISVDRESV